MKNGAPAPSGLRYGDIARSLWSLRTPLHFDAVSPADRGVPYRPRAARGIEPLLDVYVPRDPSGASVVLVHGGGFVIGTRDMKPMRFLASRLTAAGIAVATVDYRLIFRGGRLDEALDDVCTALAFFRDRCAGYGLDPAWVSLAGLSAGGTLAHLAASRVGATIHRLVCVFGLYELDHLHGPLASVMPRLLFRTADRDAWAARSPSRVPQPRVPTLLLHGTRDGLVPVGQAERLAARREAEGLPTRLVLYPDAPHGFFNFPSHAADDGAAQIATHVLER